MSNLEAQLARLAALKEGAPDPDPRCRDSIVLYCEYARHEGPHWSGSAEAWLGLAPRCSQASPRGGFCWRASGHRGEHEDEPGRTWRKRRR